MVKARKFVVNRPFQGVLSHDNFLLVEEELPELQVGEFLVEALYLSVDPYMRSFKGQRLVEGDTIIGSQVGIVKATRNGEYPLGTRLVGYWGWRTHTIVDPKKAHHQGMDMGAMHPLPDLGRLPASLGLGAVGMPGNTAYFGFLEICQPKPGDVVVVSGAAGAVGSLVGQIAKIKGCYVIGYAGSDDKVQWLVEELGFDRAFNYKTADWNESLKEAAPNGVDCYFDNVGGEFSWAVRNHMKLFGRIAVCGAISTYNNRSGPPTVPACEMAFVSKQLRMEGFLVHRWNDRWQEGLHQMAQWVKDGKVKVQETVTEGFEKMPDAFMDMLQGKNTGKAVVKV